MVPLYWYGLNSKSLLKTEEVDDIEDDEADRRDTAGEMSVRIADVAVASEEMDDIVERDPGGAC